MGCTWGPANHTYFQLANMFLAFSYLVPNNLKGLFILRFVLGAAGFFFSLWAGIILCSPDTLGWNLAFTIINFGHVAYLLIKMRPIKFEEEHEICYENIFELLGVARWQYNVLAQLGKATELAKGHVYASEDLTDGTDISIVLHGSCVVSKGNTKVGRVKAYEFLDSPEWIMSTQGGGAYPVTFEVTIKSEGCVIITWNRNALVKIFRREPFLKHIFDSIIGQDVAKKIFAQNKVMFNDTDQKVPTVRSMSNQDGGVSECDGSGRFGRSPRFSNVHRASYGSKEDISGKVTSPLSRLGRPNSGSPEEKAALLGSLSNEVHISLDEKALKDSPNTNV